MNQTWQSRLQNYQYRHILCIGVVISIVFAVISVLNIKFFQDYHPIIMTVSGLSLIVLIHFLYTADYLRLLPKTYRGQLLALFVWIIIGMYLTVFVAAYLPIFTNSESCYKKCTSSSCNWLFTKLNGKNSLMDLLGLHGNRKIPSQQCAITPWMISHFVGHGFVAFLLPKMWLNILIGGVLWESLESTLGTSSWFDLVWNTGGVLSGVLLRKFSKL